MAYSKLVFLAGGVPAISDTNLNVITNGLDSAITYPTAGGTATALTLTAYHFTLTDGVAVNFVASASNSAAATTINVNALGAKSVYKPGGTVAPNIEAGKYYTAIYNAAGSCFFVKANASGNALVSDVLATKTFSNDSGTDLTGTMPNNAGDVNAVSSHSGGGGTIHIVPAKGYTDGSDDASVITDAEFLAANIKHNVEIFGLTGNYDTEAVAPIAVGTVLNGKVGFVNGEKITGTLALTGDAVVGDVLTGKKFYKDDALTQLTGTMTAHTTSASDVTLTFASADTAIPVGHYNGTPKVIVPKLTSGNNQVVASGEKTTNSEAGVKVWEGTVNFNGTYKCTTVVWGEYFGNNATVAIYKDGELFGASHLSENPSTTSVENLSFSAGEKMQVYLSTSTSTIYAFCTLVVSVAEAATIITV